MDMAKRINFTAKFSKELFKVILLLIKDGGKSFNDIFLHVNKTLKKEIFRFDLELILIFLESQKLIEADHYAVKKEPPIFATSYSYNKIDYTKLNELVETLASSKKEIEFVLDEKLTAEMLKTINDQNLSFLEIKDAIEKKQNKKLDWLAFDLHLYYLQKKGKLIKRYKQWDDKNIESYKLL